MNTKRLAALMFMKLNSDAIFAERVYASNEPFRAMYCECNIPEVAQVQDDGSALWCDLMDNLEQLNCDVKPKDVERVCNEWLKETVVLAPQIPSYDMYLFLDEGPAANDPRF